MTITSTVNIARFVGDGVSKVFAAPFRFFSAGDLIVSIAAADGADGPALVAGVDYSVTGGAEGGSVTFTAAPPAGRRVVVARKVPALQTTDYVENDGFPAEAHEAALDRLAAAVQDGAAGLSRAALVPLNETEPMGPLPPKAARAGRLAGYDVNGHPSVSSITTDEMEAAGAVVAAAAAEVEASKNAAAGAAAASANSATAAAGSKNAAAQSEANASASSVAAANSATAAAGSKNAAAQSEANASASASAAANSATAAAASKNAAAQSEANASVAAVAAGNFSADAAASKTAAAQSKDDAALSAVAALASKNAAAQSEANAAASAAEAASWVGATGVWGSIAGNIADQMDLAAALGSKAPKASPSFTGIATLQGLRETVAAMAAGAMDLSAATIFTKTITGATVISATNASAGSEFTLRLTNGGAFAVTWPGGFKWPGGTAPVLTAAGTDVISGITRDGVNWDVAALMDVK